MASKKLTDKQKKFCQEYLIDLNATRAAIDAGYSKKTAFSIGPENLKKPYLQEYLQKLRDKLAAKTEITPERIIRELANIAFLDASEMFDEYNNLLPINEMPEEVRRAINGLEVSETKLGGSLTKIKVSDKKGALELIGKHLAMWTDRHEITGKDGGPVRFSGMSDDELRELLTRTA